MKSGRDCTKLWDMQGDLSVGEFSNLTGIHYLAVRNRTELTMPMICLAAYKLGCRISDLANLEEE